MSLPSPSIPIATYRLQLCGHLTFDAARALVGYVADLGVGAAYLSPFFRARAGSSHGYDVVDHGEFNPELGTEKQFHAFAKALRDQGLGLIVDIVPNHMGIDDPHNGWWQDVLENGPASQYARFFDIDWSPPKEALRARCCCRSWAINSAACSKISSCIWPTKTSGSTSRTTNAAFLPTRAVG